VASVPLPDGALDVAVFCLALMGSNYADFLREAHRTLKPGGLLKIAEVRSRFRSEARFEQTLRALGFDVRSRAGGNSHFLALDCAKSGRAPERDVQAEPLMPCLYKRR